MDIKEIDRQLNKMEQQAKNLLIMAQIKPIT